MTSTPTNESPAPQTETDELRMLRERLGPHGLEVIEINGRGHYVNEAVKAEIVKLRADNGYDHGYADGVEWATAHREVAPAPQPPVEGLVPVYVKKWRTLIMVPPSIRDEINADIAALASPSLTAGAEQVLPGETRIYENGSGRMPAPATLIEQSEQKRRER